MVFFIAALLLIVLYGIRIGGAGKFNTEYLKKERTTAVNGIFVILVVFSHYSQYADFNGIWDAPYIALRTHLNQLVVATFMFYSGYGMMEAVKYKGRAYILRTGTKFWQLLLRFDTAVLLYLLVDKALEIKYSTKEILLAFTSWTSVGNSNWYITAILMLYASLMIAFTIGLRVEEGFKGRAVGITLMFVFTAALVGLQNIAGRPPYCFNTMMIFPLGCLYSECHNKIEKAVMKNELTYIVCLVTAVGLYVYLSANWRPFRIGVYSLWGAAFISLVLLITMKVSIYNKVLEWFGTHIFSIYILQRLPMTILSELGFIKNHEYIGLILSMTITAIIAIVFEKLTDSLIGGVTRLIKGLVPKEGIA